MGTGKFSSEKHEEFPLTVKPRRIYSLINTVCLNLLVVPAFLGHIGILAFSGSLVQLSLALVLVVILYIGLKKFIGLTKISKGSAYGQNKSDLTSFFGFLPKNEKNKSQKSCQIMVSYK